MPDVVTFSREKYVNVVSYCFSFQSLSFQKINRVITAVDSQPMFDGGILINVLGRLQVRMCN
jgi:hypothetical protein